MPMPPRWSIRRYRQLLGSKYQLVAGLLGFVIVAWLVELVAGLRTIHIGPLFALVLAAVPAAFWLGFFYLMDRHEPEPKPLVAGVCVLGALVAAPLADFVQYQAVPPVALEAHGLSVWSADRLLYSVLIAGLAQEVCKYAAVRYTVYLSREFDEPMDGVIYMMACGTGFAVWANYHTLARQGHSVILSEAAAQSVIFTLAHASFAGAFGYFLGRAKFSRRSAPVRGIMLMAGLFAAAMLNGLFELVASWARQSAMAQHPWRGIGYAAVCAVAIFGVVWGGSQHLLRTSPFRRPS
jgi:RsiW-degrading membrane proteinase PrsW (M82 family)